MITCSFCTCCNLLQPCQLGWIHSTHKVVAQARHLDQRDEHLVHQGVCTPLNLLMCVETCCWGVTGPHLLCSSDHLWQVVVDGLMGCALCQHQRCVAWRVCLGWQQTISYHCLRCWTMREPADAGVGTGGEKGGLGGAPWVYDREA